MSQEMVTCKSCNNQFTGTYCNVCGEKVINHDDRKLKYFLGDLLNALTFADSKLWRTLKSILITPGKFSNDFVEGKRNRYMKPVSIFFLANLLYFLLPTFNTFNSNLNLQMTDFWHSNLAKEMVNHELTKSGIDLQEYSNSYNKKTAELSKLFLIIMAGLLALFSYPIHLGSNKKLLADHLVLGLETMVFILLFCIMFLSYMLSLLSYIDIVVVNDRNLTFVGIVALLYFFGSIEYHFFGFRKFRMFFNPLLSILAVAFSISIYRSILFFITFWSI